MVDEVAHERVGALAPNRARPRVEVAEDVDVRIAADVASVEL
jgi:hypothetical protein